MSQQMIQLEVKTIEKWIDNYRGSDEDTDLLTNLNSIVNVECPRLIAEDDFKLSNEIITIFNNQYKTDIFQKIKLNVTITTIERSKIDCFTLSIAVISQCKDMASLEQLSGYIIGYLDEFSCIDKINSTILRMVQICLYALSNVNKDYRDLSYIDMSTTLLKYFNMNSDKIKVPSGYLLVTQFNKQSITTMDLGEMRKVVDYLNNIVEKMNVSKFETFLGFYLGSKERLKIQRATNELDRLRIELNNKKYNGNVWRFSKMESLYRKKSNEFRMTRSYIGLSRLKLHNERMIRRSKSLCSETSNKKMVHDEFSSNESILISIENFDSVKNENLDRKDDGFGIEFRHLKYAKRHKLKSGFSEESVETSGSRTSSVTNSGIFENRNPIYGINSMPGDWTQKPGTIAF